MSSWSRALDQLVRERGPALYGYAFVLTGDKHAAEDLVQDALIRTFRRGRYTGSLDSTHAYVKRAITTAFIDTHRRALARPQREHGAAGDTDATPASAALPDPSGQLAEALDLHRAILTLPPRERACVVLRYLEDKSTQQVADELGLATGSVKRYLSDAVVRLRTTYGELELPESSDSDTTVSVVHHSGGTS
jgi:RNA polymerase sigma factor (sigma-70 family)